MSSRLVNLPDILKDAAKGNITPDFARQHLLLYRESLLDTDQGFQASLTSQDGAVTDAAASVNRLLGLLKVWAQEAIAALDDDDRQSLGELGESIREVTHDLNVALANYREVSLIALGPTALAGVNLIMRALNHQLQKHGRISDPEPIREDIEQELARVQQALTGAVSQRQLETALKSFQASLQKLDQDVQSGDLVALEAALDLFLEAAQGLEEVLEQLQSRDTLVQGPSRFGRINVFLNLGTRLLTGSEDAEEFQEAAASLASSSALWRNQLNVLLRKLERSSSIDDQGQKVDQAYERFALDLEEYAACVLAQDQEDAERMVEAVVQGWEEVVAAQKELEQLLEAQGKVPCVRCGCYNRNDKRNCEQCGAILPVVAEERTHMLDLKTGEANAAAAGEAVPTAMTENLQRLFDSVDGYLKLQHDRQQLQADVEWMLGLVRQTHQNLIEDLPQADPAAPEQPPSDTVSPLALYLEGLQDMEAGLGFLAQMQEASVTIAETGMGLIWEGAGKIQRSLREQAE